VVEGYVHEKFSVLGRESRVKWVMGHYKWTVVSCDGELRWSSYNNTKTNNVYAVRDVVRSSGIIRRDLDQFGVTVVDKIHENYGSVFLLW